MTHDRLVNEPSDYIFEAFDAWQDNDKDEHKKNSNLLERGSDYQK